MRFGLHDDFSLKMQAIIYYFALWSIFTSASQTNKKENSQKRMKKTYHRQSSKLKTYFLLSSIMFLARQWHVMERYTYHILFRWNESKKMTLCVSRRSWQAKKAKKRLTKVKRCNINEELILVFIHICWQLMTIRTVYIFKRYCPTFRINIMSLKENTTTVEEERKRRRRRIGNQQLI